MMKKNNISLENDSYVISDEKAKNLQLSAEEKLIIEEALALAETAEMLPSNPDKILDAIDKKLPDDFEKGLEKFAELAQKDPKLYQQILALYEVTNEVREVTPTVEKVSQTTIANQKLKNIINKK